MYRDLDGLTSHPFDLLVVGGGIHGMMAAWDASLRGLRVAVIDRYDFGGRASFHHHRTLHGGLRYLQTGDIGRLRQSVRERRTWAHIAPHLIARQAFAVEAGGARGKPEALLRAGFALDALLTARRNLDVAEELQLPPARIAPRGDLDTGGLLDGRRPLGVWYDYRTAHAERLTLGVAISAARAGATLANYVDAIEPLRQGRRVRGVQARDLVGGLPLAISARVVLNATGSDGGRLMAAFGVRRAPPLVKAMNVVTTRMAPEVACGARTDDGRLLFALPVGGRLSIGTWHGPTPCGADVRLVTHEELGAFVGDVNRAFPSLRLTLDDLAVVQRAVVPAVVGRGRVRLADTPIVREHRQDGVDGAITLIGVKYTTARALAAQAVTLAMAQLGRHAPSQTASRALPGCSPTGSTPPVDGFDAEAWGHLQRCYGDQAPRVADYARANPSLAERITPAQPVTGVQVVEAVRHEMALSLEDIVLRRTGLGSAGYPGDEAVLRVEAIAREELGWNSARVRDEVQGLEEFYLPVHVSE
jgi:glycerol-3-phosphate dehydrogenase